MVLRERPPIPYVPEKDSVQETVSSFKEEAREKVATGQATIVDWDKIKDNPPPQMKVSPIAAIPHKPKAFRSILDLLLRRSQTPPHVFASTSSLPSGCCNSQCPTCRTAAASRPLAASASQRATSASRHIAAS